VTAWDPRVLIAAKRDGQILPPSEVERFVSGVVTGEVAEAQASAFLMACLLRGMDGAETLAMTRAMIASGDTVVFDGIGAPTVDKHSTGGVADGVTLVFAPLAASVGLAVAKLSGRGLGHTGGTLDKLESIPGFRTDLTPDEIADQVERIGCAVAAQSPRLVPADGALYALRDATATVPSIPLIAASVMSKKLAVQTDLILLDVKCGSGAFMKTETDARGLAGTCRELARGADRNCGVAVTDMSQPLGDAVGNALDVVEATAVLRGEHRGRLRELAVWFVARAIETLQRIAFDEAVERATDALDDGSALERFAAMIEAQGGDPRVLDDPDLLPAAPVVVPIPARRSATLAGVDAEAVGHASTMLGAGRIRKGDAIDPAVGIVLTAKVGDEVTQGETLGAVHARTLGDADAAIAAIEAACAFAEGDVLASPLVLDWVGPDGGGERT
jgi:pyrimidine-nucleoside phosphorylase